MLISGCLNIFSASVKYRELKKSNHQRRIFESYFIEKIETSEVIHFPYLHEVESPDI